MIKKTLNNLTEWIRAFYLFIKFYSLHKWMVGKILFKKKMYWQAITHDITKMLPDEAFGYICHNRRDYDSCPDLQKIRSYTQKLHDIRNRHHFGHWIKNGVPSEMPKASMLEMLADWESAAKMKAGKFQSQSTWQQWYREMQPNIHPKNKKYIDEIIKKSEEK